MDDAYRSLGEMWFGEQGMLELTLSAQGEILLGSWVQEWQTQGLLITRTITNKEGHYIVAVRIQMRSVEFKSALIQWLEENGYCSLILPEYCLGAWHMVCQMPVSTYEKFTLGLKLKSLPESEAAKWKKGLQELLVQEDAPVKGKR